MLGYRPAAAGAPSASVAPRCRWDARRAVLALGALGALWLLERRARRDNCVALYGEFGQTANRVVLVGKLQALAIDEGAEWLVLDDRFALRVGAADGHTMYSWTMNWAAAPQDLAVPIRPGLVGWPLPFPGVNRCRVQVGAEAAWFRAAGPKSIEWNDRVLTALRPKEEHRAASQRALTELRKVSRRSKVVVVHSRNFEDGCFHFLAKYSRKLHPEWYCPALTQASVLNNIMPALGLDPAEYAIILSSDGQRPEEDSTFEHRFEGTYREALWLFTDADYLIGSGASTAELLVDVWRHHLGTNCNSPI
jgi:hypothetical protein